MTGPVLPPKHSFGWTKDRSSLRFVRPPRPRQDPQEADGVLMERARNGDQQAFGVILERYWAALVSYVAGIVEEFDAADDVAQMAVIRLWQHRHDWTGSGSLRSYLFRIAHNLALNARRDRSTNARRNEGFRQAVSRSPGPSTPAEDLAAELLREEVEAAIERLPERRRAVFVLARFYGLSQREISEALGIAPQTVANQMQSALAELRDTLGHHLR